MAIIADFMLVWLPAPTVSLRPPLSLTAGPIAKFFYSCPDNAFQVIWLITLKFEMKMFILFADQYDLFDMFGILLVGGFLWDILLASPESWGNSGMHMLYCRSVDT